MSNSSNHLPSECPDSPDCCSHKKKPALATKLLGQGLRFSGWFIGFAGLFSISAACPFCGKAGCPVGGASAGIAGLFFGSLAQWGGSIFRAAAGFFRNKF